MRLCAIIPTLNNPQTLETVVNRVRAHIHDVVVVDDGSDEASRKLIQRLADTGLCQAIFRDRNGGKGAAVKTGLRWAREHAFDYALQIDADLQHDPNDIPAMVAAALRDSGKRTLVLAQPIFDQSAPRGRLLARKITQFMAMVETLSSKVGDPLCGYRVYPVEAAIDARARGEAMDFDPEIAVRLAWAGIDIVHIPSRVIYRQAAEGGVSHYRGVADTLLIASAHVRLCVSGLWILATKPLRALLRWVRT
jgi:glycosyltransferase involved in cell wall biosynthesis